MGSVGQPSSPTARLAPARQVLFATSVPCRTPPRRRRARLCSSCRTLEPPPPSHALSPSFLLSTRDKTEGEVPRRARRRAAKSVVSRAQAAPIRRPQARKLSLHLSTSARWRSRLVPGQIRRRRARLLRARRPSSAPPRRWPPSANIPPVQHACELLPPSYLLMISLYHRRLP